MQGFFIVATNLSRRGRPRRFNPEAALAIGQAMFHEHGYDGVGLAALTAALAIKPPSFYAAFGSKARFFERVLDRYCASALPVEKILCDGRPVADALAALLVDAARTYAADPNARGCLVLEAARSSIDGESAMLARTVAQRNRNRIRHFVAQAHPAAADAVTDMIVHTMSGLSACAREGLSVERLTAVACTAMIGIRAILGGADGG